MNGKVSFKLALFSCLVIVWLLSASSVVVGEQSQLWMKQDDAATNYVRDHGSVGNHGTVLGAERAVNGQGNGDPALKFDGKDDYVDIGSGAEAYDSDSISVAVWFKVDEFQKKGGLIGDGGKYTLRVSKDRVGWTCSNKDKDSSSSVGGGQIEKGEWHHAVGVYDTSAKNQSLYVDGVLVAYKSTDFKLAEGEHNQVIGASYKGAQDHFEGSIGDVKFYDRAVSSSEVNQLYQLKKVTKGLASWWKMDISWYKMDMGDTSDGLSDSTVDTLYRAFPFVLILVLAAVTYYGYGKFNGVNDLEVK